MLRRRSLKLVTEIEVNRQLLIWDILVIRKLDTSYPGLTGFEIKNIYEHALAICGNYLRRDPVKFNRAMICKDEILKLLDGDNPLKNIEPNIIVKIEETLKNKNIIESNVYWLQHKKLTEIYVPEPVKRYPLSVATKVVNDVSIVDFEYMAFGNHIIYRLFDDTSFVDYFYQNAIHSAGIVDAKYDISKDPRWQLRLCFLLKNTNFTNEIAIDAFYKNVVKYDNVFYDTSYVPKFNVRDLKRYQYTESFIKKTYNGSSLGFYDIKDDEISEAFIEPLCVNKLSTIMSTECTDGGKKKNNHKTATELLEYRNDLNVRVTDRVPLPYLRIFITFPFKDGHVVDRRTGEITFIEKAVYNKYTNHALVEYLRSMYNTSNFEGVIYECSKAFTVDELLSFVAYTDELDLQGMGLISIRAMVGDNLRLSNDIVVRLPYANEVCAWLKNYCMQNKCVVSNIDKLIRKTDLYLLLPRQPKYDSIVTKSLTCEYVQLIRDIVQTARSRYDCAFLCSGYTILQTLYILIYNELKTDAEIYIFLTIAIQDCGLITFREYRSTLHPKWPTHEKLTVNELYTKHEPNVRTMDLKTVMSQNSPDRKMNAISVSDYVYRPTRETLDDFEFCDADLRTLVNTGTSQLTEEQIISSLVVFLSKKK